MTKHHLHHDQTAWMPLSSQQPCQGKTVIFTIKLNIILALFVIAGCQDNTQVYPEMFLFIVLSDYSLLSGEHNCLQNTPLSFYYYRNLILVINYSSSIIVHCQCHLFSCEVPFLHVDVDNQVITLLPSSHLFPLLLAGFSFTSSETQQTLEGLYLTWNPKLPTHPF